MAGPITGPGINSINQQAKPGSMNLPQALWHVLQVIGTPNKNSQVGGLLGQVASQAKNPMNVAMMLPGEGDLAPYNLEHFNPPKAVNEGQPYDVRDMVGRLKALSQRQHYPEGIDTLPHMQKDISGYQARYIKQLYDTMFTHFNGAGFPKPPSPKGK